MIAVQAFKCVEFAIRYFRAVLDQSLAIVSEASRRRWPVHCDAVSAQGRQMIEGSVHIAETGSLGTRAVVVKSICLVCKFSIVLVSISVSGFQSILAWHVPRLINLLYRQAVRCLTVNGNSHG